MATESAPEPEFHLMHAVEAVSAAVQLPDNRNLDEWAAVVRKVNESARGLDARVEVDPAGRVHLSFTDPLAEFDSRRRVAPGDWLLWPMDFPGRPRRVPPMVVTARDFERSYRPVRDVHGEVDELRERVQALEDAPREANRRSIADALSDVSFGLTRLWGPEPSSFVRASAEGGLEPLTADDDVAGPCRNDCCAGEGSGDEADLSGDEPDAEVEPASVLDDGRRVRDEHAKLLVDLELDEPGEADVKLTPGRVAAEYVALRGVRAGYVDRDHWQRLATLIEVEVYNEAARQLKEREGAKVDAEASPAMRLERAREAALKAGCSAPDDSPLRHLGDLWTVEYHPDECFEFATFDVCSGHLAGELARHGQRQSRVIHLGDPLSDEVPALVQHAPIPRSGGLEACSEFGAHRVGEHDATVTAAWKARNPAVEPLPEDVTGQLMGPRYVHGTDTPDWVGRECWRHPRLGVWVTDHPAAMPEGADPLLMRCLLDHEDRP